MTGHRDLDELAPHPFPGFRDDAPLVIPGMDRPEVQAALAAKVLDRSFEDFAHAAGRVGHCARPVRLTGSSVTVDTTTGEVVDSVSSHTQPLGVVHTACGNRRAHVCPACSRTYARDTFALIHAGIAGGKSVPEQVADNPLLFVTLTAPSFGPVHGHRSGNPCRPRRTTQRTRCEHERPMWCQATHGQDDPANGAPFCPDCHDTATAVLWQWHAPELWRRLTISLRRAIAHHLTIPPGRLGEVASVQYAKVAEYQSRGLIHFHALIRLDGPAGDGIGAPAPTTIDGPALARLIKDTAPRVEVNTEPLDPDDHPRTLTWGTQLDVRVVRAGIRTDDPDWPLTPGQVAGYLAKYSTKDASGITGSGQTRPHITAFRRTCQDLADRAAAHHGQDHDYQRMNKWVHALGFRGHFGTKSRRYSITLGALRRARARWQAHHARTRRHDRPVHNPDPDDLLIHTDEDDTTQVIGTWSYAGSGWADSTEEALAIAAATRAREYDQWKAHQRQDPTH